MLGTGCVISADFWLAVTPRTVPASASRKQNRFGEVSVQVHDKRDRLIDTSLSRSQITLKNGIASKERLHSFRGQFEIGIVASNNIEPVFRGSSIARACVRLLNWKRSWNPMCAANAPTRHQPRYSKEMSPSQPVRRCNADSAAIHRVDVLSSYSRHSSSEGLTRVVSEGFPSVE